METIVTEGEFRWKREGFIMCLLAIIIAPTLRISMRNILAYE